MKSYYNDSDENRFGAVHCPYRSMVRGNRVKFTYV